MSAPLDLKNLTLEGESFTARATVVFLMALVLVLVLVARLVQLQVLEHDSYSIRSDDNRIQVRTVPPDRGLIFDRRGALLADNRPVRSLNLVTELIDEPEAVIEELRALVEISDRHVEEFRERHQRRRPFEPVALKMNLPEEEVARVRVNGHRWPGVEITEENLRYYPLGDLMAHAVGSVRRVTEEDAQHLDKRRYRGVKFIGRLGVEKFHEDLLHGEVGWQHIEIDARGRVHRILEETPAVVGRDLTLHLDSYLQAVARDALDGRRGAVVAIEPKSGGIMALVSNPGYDPNLFVTGIARALYEELATSRDAPLFNRAVMGRYAPGSTFKAVVALAGLAAGVTDWERTIVDNGEFRLPGRKRVYRDWSWQQGNSGGQGIVHLRKAIYRSSNVYFYDLASRMDIDVLSAFAAQFGYGEVTSLDVADAVAGVLPSRAWKQSHKGDRWYAGDSVNVGIGQGDLLATPLQLATVAAVIANRGRWVRPRLMLATDGAQPGFDLADPRPRVAGPSDEDWEMLVDAMEDVVHRGNQGFRENGTAWFNIGRDIAYRMAGKSGTAQVVEIAQGQEYDEEALDEYSRKHAWFIAFAPADDPALAVSVLVENGGGGSSVAAPVARTVLDAYLAPQLARL